jgi:signal transduction histidine kinase
MASINSIYDVVKKFDRSLLFSVFIPVFVALCILIIFFTRQQKVLSINNANLISSNIATLKSNISEKLSIIATSTDFKRYLRSGKMTRKKIYAAFNIQMSSLNTPEISGIQIYDDSNKLIYLNGEESRYFADIPICYLDDELNSRYGNCIYTFKIYFNYLDTINSLTKINPSIVEGSEFEQDFFSDKKIGNFSIVSSSSMPLGLAVLNHTEHHYLLILFLFLIMGLFIYLFLTVRIKRIFSLAISNPIREIVNAIKLSDKIDVLDNSDYLEEFRYLIKEIRVRDDKIKFTKENEKLAEIGKIAMQVAHDIRSPLMALDAVIKTYEFDYKYKDIIINATHQIHDIANNVLSEYRNGQENMIESVYECISSVVDNIKVRFKGKVKLEVNFSNDAYGVMIDINKSDFIRALINIANNACEAISNTGVVKLIVEFLDKNVQISIIDNGIGMTREQIECIDNQNIKSTKLGGNALGIKYAINKAEEWGAKFFIHSDGINHGTKASFIIPVSKYQKIFTSNVSISTHNVILDDDPFIHDIWLNRVNELKLNKTTLYRCVCGNDVKSLLASFSKETLNDTRFFVDFDLGHDNGLSIVENLSIAKNTTLVTSSYNDKSIIIKCEQLGITILPKIILAHVDIYMESRKIPDKEIILIDDNINLCKSWVLLGRKKGVCVHAFNSFREFEMVCSEYDTSIPIYIDSDLGLSENTGEECAKKIFDQYGFESITLVTGKSKLMFQDMYWIKDIKSKIVPFT